MRSSVARRGSALTEYALLLTTICCSVLFGARLILTSITLPHATLANHLAGESRADHFPPDSVPIIVRQDGLEPQDPGETNTARQIGFLVVLLGCAVITSIGLLRTIRRRGAPANQVSEDSTAPVRIVARFATKRQEIFQVLSKNVRDLLSSHLSVGQIQTRSPVCVPMTAARAQLQEMMRESQFRHLLVCDAEGLLVGIISDRDFRSGSGATAAEIMTAKPWTIDVTADIRASITLMLSRRISALPVVEQRRPIGILTVTDLVLMLQATLQLLDKLHGALSDGEDPAEADSVEEELVLA